MVSVPTLQRAFLDYLNEQPLVLEPKELYEPIEYVMHLGGKRIRPILALLSCSLFGKDFREALPVAFAVEVFHNFSLVHDDIMDESPLRRGKPAVHVRYDVNTGILSGDLMLIIAYQYLNITSQTDIVPRLLEVFTDVAKKVCEGQQYDINFESLEQVDIQDYLRMIELKTAVLLSGALRLGALTARAADADVELLGEFGRLTGVAFQLQDDYLDVFGDPAQIGKRAGNDIVRNKKTYLYLKALELANPSDQAELLHWYRQQPTDPSEKIAAVIAIMQRLGIPELSCAIRDEHQQRAYAALDAVGVAEAQKAPLRALADQLLQRHF